MTNSFEPGDPVGSWLGADVELLPPKPGGFQKVRRRARRRKAVQGLSAAAGTVVAIAAIVTAPQIASTLLQHGAAKITGASNSPTPSLSGPSVKAPLKPAKPGPPGSGRPLQPGIPMSPAGSGVAVPAGFQPESVTFIGPHSGAVLGQLGSPCHGVCTALAGTSDYGQNWYSFSAPAAAGPAGDAGVSQVRFYNWNDGWVFGPELYATHDGGKTWKKPTGLPSGRVIDLAAVSGRVFAVLASCTGGGAAYATGCTSFALISADTGSDIWAPVTGASGTGAVAPGGLQLTQRQGYLLVAGALYTGAVSGGAWHQVPVRAQGAPACLAGSGGPAQLAPGRTALYLTCQRAGVITLYSSTDSGLSWSGSGAITTTAQATSLAVTPPQPGSKADSGLVLATTDLLYVSIDFSSWSRAALLNNDLPAGGFRFVGMTTSAEGVAVAVNGQLHEVFTTTDGGSSWAVSVIH